MKQLSVLCLSLALMFSLSGCCCGLFGNGYGAGYPGGGCNCNQQYPAFYNGGAVVPGTNPGNCGPGGCGVSYPNTIYNGSAAIQPGGPIGPTAYVPTPAMQTY